MDFTFFDYTGRVLFVRSDAEQAHWVQQEMSLTCVFPFDASKVITHGMRVAFTDPATDFIECFEIRVVQNVEPDHYQQITAEHIVISELTDEHIDNTEITDKTPLQALQAVFSASGVTYWQIGNVGATNISSCDIGRGSVWQGIKTIEENWNVYCIPRVTTSASGITGRYIDVIKAGGTFRGLRLSISKNIYDSSVTYDDSEVLTALYGYGGSVDKPQATGFDKAEELNFAEVTWTKTSDHPAKPAGQKYLEWPEKTAIYGRNGRPRYGYYQNADIESASILLQKTWETLKQSSEPKISITGTVADLYRLGYTGEPLRLHDIAIVEIEETGELLHREIIALDLDLLDFSASMPEIGDYTENIVYISRDTNRIATTGKKGSGGGGGGGKGSTNSTYNESKYFTEWVKTDQAIGMVVGRKNGEVRINAGQICLAINDSDESTALINADHVNISATSTVYTLAGDLEHKDGKLIIKSGGGLYVQKNEGGTTATFGVWDKGSLTGGVMVTQINNQSALKLKADVIDIDGVVKELAGIKINVGEIQAGYGDFRGCNIDSLSVDGNDFYICTMTIDGVNKGAFLGSNDINFNKAARLSPEYGGTNTGTVATYTVTGTPEGNFPSGNVAKGEFTIHVNNSAAWITDKSGTIRARTDNTGYTNGYKVGWNECIDTCNPHTYLRNFTAYNSRSKIQLYYFDSSGKAVSAGYHTWWYTDGDQRVTAYTIPTKK